MRRPTTSLLKLRIVSLRDRRKKRGRAQKGNGGIFLSPIFSPFFPPLHPSHCLISNREVLGRIRVIWDKLHETHIVRKSTMRLDTFSSLVFIGSIFNEIQPSGRSVLYIFKFINSCILLSLARFTPNLRFFQT